VKHYFIKRQLFKINILWMLWLFVMPASAESSKTDFITVVDDAGRSIELAQPARRVISLSPHITELIYAAGGDKKIIAAVDFSNYPQQAKALPRVGSGYQLDVEGIVALKPDLIIAWRSGNSRGQLEQLENLGLKVYYSEPEKLVDIAENLRDFGKLLASSPGANKKADKFLLGIEQLKDKYKNAKKVSVFYQVWNQPIFTINRQHIISHIIELCGGENIFKELNVIFPQVDIESVIRQNQDVIIAGVGEGRTGWLSDRLRWQYIKGVM